MRSKAVKLLKLAGLVLGIALVTVLGVRIVDTQRGPPLELWHTFKPDELDARELAAADWRGYLAAEEKAVAQVRDNVTARLPASARVPSNRYFDGGPIYPGRFERDWNRSYVLVPDGAPRGAAVFLHGLTDSPYSLRHIARRYQELGWVAVAPRLPGHGTVPSGLSDVRWEAWEEATRLAVREARRLAGDDVPLHVVGFSNGGALAMKYVLDTLDEPSLRRPDRVVLIAPMIGITSLARFAGVMGWPAVIPRFAKAAWLGIVPEFNPFKYNSFPVNGARQSSLVARTLQQQIDAAARSGRLAELPPILTFQSVVDFTVSTRAIVDALYARLPPNGSELVLFDVNRQVQFDQLLRPGVETAIARLLPEAPRAFRTAFVTNASAERADVVERVVEAGQTGETVRELGLAYPAGVYSLSHLALTFPLGDSLYGLKPEPGEDFGVHLGAIAARGERGILLFSMDAMLRMSSNPFFPYLLGRIEEGITSSSR